MTNKNQIIMYYIYDLDKKRQYLGTLGEKFNSEDEAWSRIDEFYDGYIHLEPRKWRKGMINYSIDR